MTHTALHNDTIVAPATAQGGALSTLRISGVEAISIATKLFRPKGEKSLSEQAGFTLHYGEVLSGEGAVIDDVLLSLFRAPHSYTGEDMVELSCHGSSYIQQQIIARSTALGARVAEPGEFTLRAFLSGKMNLSQAEAVADLIASSNESAHTLASRQMRGGYSDEFTKLRDELLHLCSLLELELDFSEEDVEFADRSELSRLLQEITTHIEALCSSFSLGNALKNGVPVAIVGSPNVGKSTLLNALLGEERAMVSEIAGTTRDVIEDTLTIGGTEFRFIDTAGIRETDDPLESMGIERTYQRIELATMVLLLLDARDETLTWLSQVDAVAIRNDQPLLVVLNKIDLISDEELQEKIKTLNQMRPHLQQIILSAKARVGLDRLSQWFCEQVDLQGYADRSVVSNARHYGALSSALETLRGAQQALEEELSSDLLSPQIREALYHLGLITGEITTDDILGSIFSKFCIGK